MTEKQAGQLLGKKIRDAIFAAQRGEITGTERNQRMEAARTEYLQNIRTK